MKKRLSALIWFVTFLGGALGFFLPTLLEAQTVVKVGQEAPDFTLSSSKGDKVSLSNFRGKSNVVLVFFISVT